MLQSNVSQLMKNQCSHINRCTHTRENSLVHVGAQFDRNVNVVLTRFGDQLLAAERAELGGGDAGGQCVGRQRDVWDASPQDVHACRVTVTQRCVQSDVSQLSTSHVLLLVFNTRPTRPPDHRYPDNTTKRTVVW